MTVINSLIIGIVTLFLVLVFMCLLFIVLALPTFLLKEVMKELGKDDKDGRSRSLNK